MDTHVDQARFAHPGFSNECCYLTVPGASPFQSLREGSQLCLPPDKPRQPTRCRGLHATAGATRPDQLKDFYRLDESLHGHRS